MAVDRTLPPSFPQIDSLFEFTDKALVELKEWMRPWWLADDPAAAGGGGGGGPTGLLATWTGLMPPVTGNGTERRVPYNADGTSLTFTLNSCWARVEPSGSFNSGFRLEKSPGGNSAFVPTTIATVSITAGNYEASAGAFTVTVSSGDVLRLVYTAVGSPINYEVQLEGHV
jgi:hypothetical protein